MYVVILGCVAGLALAELFHWALHVYGYGLTSVGALLILGAMVLTWKRW